MLLLASTATPTLTPDAAGTYVLTLTVDDGELSDDSRLRVAGALLYLLAPGDLDQVDLEQVPEDRTDADDHVERRGVERQVVDRAHLAGDPLGVQLRQRRNLPPRRGKG